MVVGATVVEVVVVDVVVVGSGTTGTSVPVKPCAIASAACRPAPVPASEGSSMVTVVVTSITASEASGVKAANAYTDSSATATQDANETIRVNLKITLRPGGPRDQVT